MASDKEPLSVARLTALISAPPSSLSAADLAEILTDYEAEACLLFTEDPGADVIKLLLLFYSSFFASLMLTNDLSVLAGDGPRSQTLFR
ncbi:MAG: hypothetical protein M1817_002501 [Caeruleum heppii]|nr:MAG: hypothetical protein M1817_002501 [Caeruleum heppii]